MPERSEKAEGPLPFRQNTQLRTERCVMRNEPAASMAAGAAGGMAARKAGGALGEKSGQKWRAGPVRKSLARKSEAWLSLLRAERPYSGRNRLILMCWSATASWSRAQVLVCIDLRAVLEMMCVSFVSEGMKTCTFINLSARAVWWHMGQRREPQPGKCSCDTPAERRGGPCQPSLSPLEPQALNTCLISHL